MKKFAFIATAALVFGLAVAIVVPVPTDAGQRSGLTWTRLTGNIQLGDNTGQDTIDISGHIEVDSSFALAGPMSFSDSVYFGGNVLFPQGTIIHMDSTAIFSGGIATFDSIRTGNTIISSGDLTVSAGDLTMSAGKLIADSIAVDVIVTTAGKGAGAGLTLDGVVATIDTVLADSVSVLKFYNKSTAQFAGTVDFTGGGTVSLDSLNADTLDVATHLTVAALTASGVATLSGGIDATAGGIVSADSANFDSVDVATHLTAAALTATGVATLSGGVTATAGGLVAVDSLNADSIDVASHLTAVAITATGAGDFASVECNELTIEGLPHVFPVSVALDDDSLADTGPHYLAVMPRTMAVRYAVLDLSSAVGAAACTLYVESETDTAALIVLTGTDDTTMTCDVDVAAGATLRVRSAPVTGSNAGAAAGTEAPDLTLWIENN